MRPLIDAGVRFDLAIGNHDEGLRHSESSFEEIEQEITFLDTPGRYYSRTYGPADIFMLDSSVPGLSGVASREQLAWLDDTLASSPGSWRIVAMHHPPFSSGRHGSTPRANELLVSILERHGLDLVLAGHDHDYERTVPICCVTDVVSGGGCKMTPVGKSRFTAVSLPPHSPVPASRHHRRPPGGNVHPAREPGGRPLRAGGPGTADRAMPLERIAVVVYGLLDWPVVMSGGHGPRAGRVCSRRSLSQVRGAAHRNSVQLLVDRPSNPVFGGSPTPGQRMPGTDR